MIPPIIFVSFCSSLQRLLDPPGSAYRSETGGLMGAIRVLTVEQSLRHLLVYS